MLRWLPENVSSYGGAVDSLLSLIYGNVAVWFVLVHVLLLYFLIRYRRRDGRRAVYADGHSLRQSAWILVPAFIVLMLDLWIDSRGARVWALIKESQPPADVEVEVVGKQFNWEIHYPGPDGKFSTADDVQMDNMLHVPVDRVVRVTLSSKDVIHSLFIPRLRLKQDAMPGRRIPVWFQATRAGEYEMPCAELCGFGHSGMQGTLVVHLAADYDAWVRQTWPGGAAQAAAGAAAGGGGAP